MLAPTYSLCCCLNEHSGRLKNNFDQDKVQKELDVQREVSQQFSRNVQEANSEINQHLDSLKDKLEKGEISQAAYDKAVANWQKGSVVLNMLASGLSAPTQSIAAATASPAVSYQIGQYFKDIKLTYPMLNKVMQVEWLLFKMNFQHVQTA